MIMSAAELQDTKLRRRTSLREKIRWCMMPSLRGLTDRVGLRRSGKLTAQPRDRASLPRVSRSAAVRGKRDQP